MHLLPIWMNFLLYSEAGLVPGIYYAPLDINDYNFPLPTPLSMPQSVPMEHFMADRVTRYDILKSIMPIMQQI